MFAFGPSKMVKIYGIMLYDHTIWESCFNVLCYMALPGVPWCSLMLRGKMMWTGCQPVQTTQDHSRPKLICYMDILWMDLQYGIHWAMLPDTYHTCILTIRGSLPDTAPWCSLVAVAYIASMIMLYWTWSSRTEKSLRIQATSNRHKHIVQATTATQLRNT